MAARLPDQLFDRVVAERTLHRCDTGSQVVVRIYQPVPDVEEPDSTWVCGFEVIGLDHEIRKWVFGVDSMQALWLSFGLIKSVLDDSVVPVAFHGGFPGETGFYRFSHEPDEEALIEHLVHAETIRRNILSDLLDEQDGPARSSTVDALLGHVTEAERIRQRLLQRIVKRHKS